MPLISSLEGAFLMNTENQTDSIFSEYYKAQPFQDRFLTEPEKAVTVIIPVIHTNELWEINLISFYREIPIAEVIIGDGGCIDNSIEIAKKFPRVRVLDHKAYKSLGFSIRNMIEEVKTDWFIYNHSDVYLPAGWFDKMQKNQGSYDWFGCRMRHTVMVEYDLDYGERPWAGTQMGKKALFEAGIKNIDDDFVYRQEDFVFSDIVRKAGGREGFIDEAFHFHQTMRKLTPWSRKIKGLKIDVEMSPEEELRTNDMQAKGIVKYLDPISPWLIHGAIHSTYNLIQLKKYTPDEIYSWIEKTNPVWLPIIKNGIFKLKIKNYLVKMIKPLKRLIGAK